MAVRRAEEEKEWFYDFLRQNKLKKTRQKELILETFLANEGHRSIEEIHEHAKKRDKKVGIVTVFRTMKSLTACGIAREISLGDGLTRFEHNYHHPLHHHLICTECRKVIEFLSPELERVQQQIVTQYRFHPLHQQIRIQICGICQECREQRPTLEVPQADTGRVFARDALRIALAVQNQEVEFYRRAARCNQDPSGREVFESMLREEEAHTKKLESELEALRRQVKGLEDTPIFLHFDFSELRNLVPGVLAEMVESDMDLDARDALKVALEAEDRAAGFFRDYAERFEDPEGKRIFKQFALESEKRYDLINRKANFMQAAGQTNS